MSVKKELADISEQYELGGDGESAVTSYLLGDAQLFEFLDSVKAGVLLSRLEDGDTDKIIEQAMGDWTAESVLTSTHQEVEVSSEERHQRALILDAKLEDALLESYQYMAEMIDEKLYKELGYQTAREYFEAKQISVYQAYRFALIGRTYEPYLNSKDHKKTIYELGTSKIEVIARKLDDQVDRLMKDGKIQIGDEEYTDEEIKQFSFRELDERIKKMSKKVEDYEVIREQKKNAELERDHLKQRNKELEERDEKYRERSSEIEAVTSDLEAAEKAFNDFADHLDRIDEGAIPERFEFRLVALIDLLLVADEKFREKFIDIIMKHDDVV